MIKSMDIALAPNLYNQARATLEALSRQSLLPGAAIEFPGPPHLRIHLSPVLEDDTAVVTGEAKTDGLFQERPGLMAFIRMEGDAIKVRTVRGNLSENLSRVANLLAILITKGSPS